MQKVYTLLHELKNNLFRKSIKFNLYAHLHKSKLKKKDEKETVERNDNTNINYSSLLKSVTDVVLV